MKIQDNNFITLWSDLFATGVLFAADPNLPDTSNLVPEARSLGVSEIHINLSQANHFHQYRHKQKFETEIMFHNICIISVFEQTINGFFENK